MYDSKIYSPALRLFFGLFAIGQSFFVLSCKKFVTIDPPQDRVVAGTVFVDDATATAAVVGIYSQMIGGFSGYMMTGALSTYPGLSADEISNPKASTTYDPFSANNLPKTNGIAGNNLWRPAYSYIYQANACLEGLAASNKVSASVRKQLIGECLMMRAWCYFYLTGLFSDVPLETTTNYQLNAVAPRTAAADVLKQIIRDLDSARTMLVPAYPTTGAVRPNLWAATALEARAYLYQKSWSASEAAATAVINSGSYSLVKDLNSVFLATSKEAIFQLQPNMPLANTSEGATYLPSSATVVPTFAVPAYTLAAFETGDLRKTAWLNSNTVSGTTYYYPYKYKVRSGATVTEYSMLERLGEQYLIRAEARAQQDNLSGAIADLDSIRVRAGLPVLSSTLDKAVVLLAVEQERRIELFMEWGHRWLDLRRTGRIDAVLGAEKANWVSYKALYPIPYAEIQKNVFLTQNFGYE